MPYALKARVDDTSATALAFTAQKTMYGGKHIAAGDVIFVFASENSGGSDLFARGVVTWVSADPRTGAVRQTPRVSLAINVTATTRRPLGRSEVRHSTDWVDVQPEAEINFKLYRQATDKIVGISAATAAFLDGYFDHAQAGARQQPH